MAFTIISAIDEARGIGRQGGLPWSLRGDLQHFKELTVGAFDQGRVNTVIMGRTTWNSLPPSIQPMPKRLNIVLTSQAASFPVEPNVLVATSLDQALEFADQYGSGDVFVIGGAKVYAEAIK
ncbi:MAG: dihydrofolate reductase, partial [Candidatus Kerfeldbacteria bacterium]|nr:dihydrofolate reductase [Candidatus Kerfeldbacteria bacterium]